MSQKTKYACDNCGKEIDNPYAEKGWIRIEGSVGVALGVYRNGCYKSDYLGSGTHDFCGWTCFRLKIEGPNAQEALPDWPDKPKELAP